MKHIKCVVVGSEDVGKTSYLITYTTNNYPAEYVPTVFDNYSANFMIDDQPINLQLWDTSGAEDYKKLRPLNYPQTDVFILCISLVEPKTIDGLVNLLGPETKEHCPSAQRILVGLKSDIRDEMLSNPELREKYAAEGFEPIPTSKGEEIKEEVGASFYIECSSKKQINIKESFEMAAKTVLNPPKTSPTKAKKTKSGKFHLFSKSKKSDEDKEKKHKDSDPKKDKKHKDSDPKKDKKHKDSDPKKDKKHKDSDHKKDKK